MEEFQEALWNIDKASEYLQKFPVRDLKENLEKCEIKKRQILQNKRKFDMQNRRRFKNLLKKEPGTKLDEIPNNDLQNKDTSILDKQQKTKVKKGICGRIQGYLHKKVLGFFAFILEVNETQKIKKNK